MLLRKETEVLEVAPWVPDAAHIYRKIAISSRGELADQASDILSVER